MDSLLTWKCLLAAPWSLVRVSKEILGGKHIDYNFSAMAGTEFSRLWKLKVYAAADEKGYGSGSC
jgi:hypothetical protein